MCVSSRTSWDADRHWRISQPESLSETGVSTSTTLNATDAHPTATDSATAEHVSTSMAESVPSASTFAFTDRPGDGMVLEARESSSEDEAENAPLAFRRKVSNNPKAGHAVATGIESVGPSTAAVLSSLDRCGHEAQSSAGLSDSDGVEDEEYDVGEEAHQKEDLGKGATTRVADQANAGKAATHGAAPQNNQKLPESFGGLKLHLSDTSYSGYKGVPPIGLTPRFFIV